MTPSPTVPMRSGVLLRRSIGNLLKLVKFIVDYIDRVRNKNGLYCDWVWLTVGSECI